MNSKANNAFVLFMVLYSILVLYIGYQIAPIHDYLGYFKHWDLVLTGQDPWTRMHGTNAYGPIHNLFAFFYALDKQLPKLLFILSWIAIGWYTLIKLSENIAVNKFDWMLIFSVWFLNPFFIVGLLGYGFNDAFVALLVFTGLILVSKVIPQFKLAVSLIAIAFATKLYPLFLLPFLSGDKRQIKQNIMLFFSIVIVVYGIAYMIWGDSVFYPFGKANGRDPAMFSLMAFVFNSYFPFGQLARDVIIGLSNLFLLLSLGLVFWKFIKHNMHTHTALFLAFIFLFMFYKVGNQQFYITYFAVFLFWVLIEFNSKEPNKAAFYTSILFAIWFGVMAGLVYPLTGRMNGDYEWLREVIGLPTFLFQLATVLMLFNPKLINKKNYKEVES